MFQLPLYTPKNPIYKTNGDDMKTIMAFNKENIADRFEIDLHDKDIMDLADRLFSTYDELYCTNLFQLLYCTLDKDGFIDLLMSYDEMTVRYEDHALIVFGKGKDTIMIEGCVNGHPVDILDYELFGE